MPIFFDSFGREAYDLLKSGYNLGSFRVSSKTAPHEGLSLKTNVSHNFDTERLFGGVSLIHKIKKYGVVLSEEWNTNNELLTNVEVKNEYTRGVNLKLSKKISINSRETVGNLKAEYANDTIALNLKGDTSTCSIAAVLGYQSYLFGYETGVNLRTNTLSLSHVGVGYETGNTKIHAFMKDGKEIGGTVYHKVNSDLEIGSVFAWSVDSTDKQFGAGFRLKLNAESSLNAKVSSACELGLCYGVKIARGLKFLCSIGCDMKKFHKGLHQVGFAIDYEQPCCE